MELLTQDIAKLLMAVLVGGVIGAEREVRRKAAGFRTIILITVGSTLFTIVSIALGGEKDAVRIAANIITGIGFLGAGAIFHDAGRVTGLTTATTIWVAAALGMGIGGGLFGLTAFAAGLVVVVLWGFSRIEKAIDRVRHSRTYEITWLDKERGLEALHGAFRESGLRFTEVRLIKRNGNIVSTLDGRGTAESHDALTRKLCADPRVLEITW
jgi:putative Mg2+ transporter-C (MgtC) family protein